MGRRQDEIEDRRAFLSETGGKILVRFRRPFEAGWFTGFVLDVGPEFFLLAIVSDDIRYDGFSCIRLRDLRKLEALDPTAKFPIEALKKRGLRTPKKPKVDLSNIGKLLETAGRAFPAVAIYRERIAPEKCYIGRIVEVTKNRVSFLSLNPDASWDDELTGIKLKEITQVGFGGDYEDALVLIAGDGLS
jgi:hypothetical protein